MDQTCCLEDPGSYTYTTSYTGVWYKLAERAVSFQWREEFAKAVMGGTGIQVGVGVPSGQQLVTLTLNPGKTPWLYSYACRYKAARVAIKLA